MIKRSFFAKNARKAFFNLRTDVFLEKKPKTRKNSRAESAHKSNSLPRNTMPLEKAAVFAKKSGNFALSYFTNHQNPLKIVVGSVFSARLDL